MIENPSFFERLVYSLVKKYREYKYPFITGLITGTLCYMYFFTNKLVQQDDIVSLFSKGSSLESGRWGLDILSLFLPDYSMPWINGVISVLLISVSACAVIKIAEIKNPVLGCLFSALFVASPSVTGMMCMPFTNAPYAVSLSLAVFACCSMVKGGKSGYCLAAVLMTFSLGIYQGFISLASAIAVVLLIKKLVVEGADWRKVLKKGIVWLLVLIVSLILYYVVVIIINIFSQTEMVSYAYSEYGILMRIRVVFTAFAGYFIKGYFSFVNSVPSLVIHLICIVLSGIVCIAKIAKMDRPAEVLLAVLLLIMLPVAVNCVYLVSSVDVMNAIIFMSFNTIYLLMIVLFDSVDGSFVKIRGAVSLGLCLVVISNIFFANRTSLKMDLQTSEMTSFYTSLMNDVYNSGVYEDDDFLCIIGSPKNAYYLDEIDSSNFIGLTPENVYEMYTKNDFIRYYLGYNVKDLPGDLQLYIREAMPEFENMPCYPEEGSIRKFWNTTTVVKLSD